MFHRTERKLGQAEVAPLNGLCNAFGQRSFVTRPAPWAGWLGIALALTVLLSTVFGTMAIDLLGKQFTTDIQLRSDRYEDTNLTLPSVSFNTCVTANFMFYADIIHEAGHALGIGGLPEEIAYIKSHPPLVDSVMNYNEESEVLLNVVDGKANLREPDCSPHPLDIMAIYALYQTVD